MNNFNLAALLSRVNLSDEERNACRQGFGELNTTQLQTEFFNYCKQWKLAPWLFTQIGNNNFNEYLDAEVLALFEEEHVKITLQNSKRNATASEFLAEFKKEGIDVIILKGNYLAHSCYKDIGYKRMNDFDILIHKEDWDRIQDVYLRLGYIPLGFGWSGEKEKPASFSHVGMAFISPDFSCIIGSQWGLKSPTTSFSVNIDEAWKTARDFDFFGVPVKTLSPEYNLLHLILHMGIYKCGIRDCMDLYNLRRTETIDEVELIRIIHQSKASNKARFTFALSDLCCPVFPEELLDKIEKTPRGFLGRRLRKRIRTAESTGDFQTSYNDYFQDVEKQVIYFNLFPKFHVKLLFYGRILKMIYFPKSEVALKLNDQLDRPSVWHKIVSACKAPYFVFSLIAQEIGWKFTVLLFLKLLVDLMVSVKNYFFKSESYFDYLKKKGIDPKAIEKAVKNIQ